MTRLYDDLLSLEIKFHCTSRVQQIKQFHNKKTKSFFYR